MSEEQINELIAEQPYLIQKSAYLSCYINGLKQENKELKSQLKGTTHCFDKEEHKKLQEKLDKINEYIETTDSINYQRILDDIQKIIKGE